MGRSALQPGRHRTVRPDSHSVAAPNCSCCHGTSVAKMALSLLLQTREHHCGPGGQHTSRGDGPSEVSIKCWKRINEKPESQCVMETCVKLSEMRQHSEQYCCTNEAPGSVPGWKDGGKANAFPPAIETCSSEPGCPHKTSHTGDPVLPH